ncbi:phosphopantetheine-binding protein [Streptacidiphilus fuscans]|uniref:Carrier domain-containing protein n=1 Tax=Streptacidiphilus fuscans TaxID=2789292 RepID=A0A931FFG5_9ACTN|nr:phosphopantetheine-binding protein [Streptacidiphilus fuscans]MBF9069816.1 hypothetical protein [Streptacidiphilus fuscans]
MGVDALLAELTSAELEEFCRRHLPDALAQAPKVSRLVGYFVPDQAAPRAAEDIAADLARRLPPAHVPRVLVPLESMPKLAGGKVDRKTLATRPILAPERSVGAPPTDDLGRWVRGVWSTVLSAPVGSVTLESSFFEVGGTSLDAIKVSARLTRVLDHDVRSAWLLKRPVLRGYLELLRAELADTPHFEEICAVAARVYGEGGADA